MESKCQFKRGGLEEDYTDFICPFARPFWSQFAGTISLLSYGHLNMHS